MYDVYDVYLPTCLLVGSRLRSDPQDLTITELTVGQMSTVFFRAKDQERQIERKAMYGT